MPRKSAPKRPPKRSAKSKAPPKRGGRDLESEYARFLDTAREAGVSDDPNAFDKALKRVTVAPKP